MSCILSLKLDWSCVWKFAQSSTKMLKPFHAWCWQYKIRLSALFSYHEIKGRVDNTKLHLLLPICPINHTFSKIPLCWNYFIGTFQTETVSIEIFSTYLFKSIPTASSNVVLKADIMIGIIILFKFTPQVDEGFSVGT